VKVGVIVDGKSEYASLGLLYEQLRRITGNEFLNPVQADIQLRRR
jgi:hypothetical protein